MQDFEDLVLTRRNFLTLAAAGLATIACGPFASTGTINKTPGDQPATLEVWGGVPAANGPDDLIAAFMQAHPSIKVNYTRYVNEPTGNTKLDSALQGGTPIDVFFSYTYALNQRIAAGLTADLSPYIKADNTISHWVNSTDGIVKTNGKYYRLPTAFNIDFMFINRDLANAANVTIPDTWTIDEYVNACQKISKTTGGKPVYGTFSPPDTARMKLGPNYYYKSGGSSSNFDNPAFRESFQLHRDMIVAKTAIPWTEVLAQNLRTYQQNPFMTGEVAIWDVQNYALRYVRDLKNYPHKFVTTFAPEPTPTGVAKPFNAGGLGDSVSIGAKSPNKEAAWTFIHYWLTDGTRYMLKGGKVPVIPGVLDDATMVDGLLGPDKDQIFDVSAFKRVAFDHSQRVAADTLTPAAADQIFQIVNSTTDRYWIGEIDLNACVQTIKQQADAALAKG